MLKRDKTTKLLVEQLADRDEIIAEHSLHILKLHKERPKISNEISGINIDDKIAELKVGESYICIGLGVSIVKRTEQNRNRTGGVFQIIPMF